MRTKRMSRTFTGFKGAVDANKILYCCFLANNPSPFTYARWHFCYAGFGQPPFTRFGSTLI